MHIVPFQEKHAAAFKSLNKEWIEKYFVMEETDHNSLDNPQGYILDKGGEILVGLVETEVIAVVALIKMDHPSYDFELAKMAVSPTHRGKGYGYQLGLACLDKAKSLGARSVYLESNTVLESAMVLYNKLGFKEIKNVDTPYERCNIQMAVNIG